jgi:hypothetical protein
LNRIVTVNLTVAVLLSFVLSGCVTGPLASHETARTVGQGNHEIQLGTGSMPYFLKWNLGLSKDVDVALQWETFTVGMRGKYAFINNVQGPSLAATLGTGISFFGGDYVNSDLIYSYLFEKWEPYGVLRVAHVESSKKDLKNSETGKTEYTIDAYEYEYAEIIGGAKYWFTDQWSMTFEGGAAFTWPLFIVYVPVVHLSVGYKF